MKYFVYHTLVLFLALTARETQETRKLSREKKKLFFCLRRDWTKDVSRKVKREETHSTITIWSSSPCMQKYQGIPIPLF